MAYDMDNLLITTGDNWIFIKAADFDTNSEYIIIKLTEYGFKEIPKRWRLRGTRDAANDFTVTISGSEDGISFTSMFTVTQATVKDSYPDETGPEDLAVFPFIKILVNPVGAAQKVTVHLFGVA